LFIIYKPIYTLDELKGYLAWAVCVGFDFKTAPLEKYRTEDKAALDAHKARIVGISFSVSERSGVYLPLKHKAVSGMGGGAGSVYDIAANAFIICHAKA